MKKERVESVKLNVEANFFNLGGRQISSTMAGIHLEWCPDEGPGCLRVTSDAFKGQTKLLLASAIAQINLVSE